jgi:uncharacterized membrane protein YhhN
MIPALVVLVAVSTAVLLLGEARGLPWVRLASKPVASAGCLALAGAAGADGPLGAGLVLALAASFVGDLALLSADRRWFLAGLGAFLLAHLAYLWTFLQLPASGPRAAVAACALVPFAAGVATWLRPHVPDRMRVPVAAYVVAICAMTGAAVAASAGPWPAPLLPVAAGSFVFSDLCVARQRFVQPGFVNRALGLPTYFAAQVAFAVLVPRLDGTVVP